MAKSVEARGRWALWRGLIARIVVSLVWAGALFGTAWLIRNHEGPSRLVDLLALAIPGEDAVQTAVQVVPAVVVAIFVFAVGTLFVVAQVVPQPRGTRAVEVLRTRHLMWTISPALALTPLSALLLVMEPDDRMTSALATALVIGATLYLFASTACLLAILGEATDPILFAALLRRRQRNALWAHRMGLARVTQAAVNSLYDTVRTLRGWARSAATSGDSRELQVALEGTLNLIRSYKREVQIADRQHVPWDYRHNADAAEVSALRPYPARVRECPSKFSKWEYWVPPHYPGIPAKDRCKHAGIWVANEVGRSLVRAVEFAATTKAILDRDRARLLLTFEKAAGIFAAPKEDEADAASAGVIIAYLIELGLDARRCAPEELEWHFEPLATLAILHTRLSSETPVDPVYNPLGVGTAAGVLMVAEASAAARCREYYERERTAQWDGTLQLAEVSAIPDRTVKQLRANPGLETFSLFKGEPVARECEVVMAKDLAHSTVLEPRDEPIVQPTDRDLLARLLWLLQQAPPDTTGAIGC